MGTPSLAPNDLMLLVENVIPARCTVLASHSVTPLSIIPFSISYFPAEPIWSGPMVRILVNHRKCILPKGKKTKLFIFLLKFGSLEKIVYTILNSSWICTPEVALISKLFQDSFSGAECNLEAWDQSSSCCICQSPCQFLIHKSPEFMSLTKTEKLLLRSKWRRKMVIAS